MAQAGPRKMGQEKGEKFMSYLNSLTIIGFVGADPEQLYGSARMKRDKRGTTTGRSSPFFLSPRCGRGGTAARIQRCWRTHGASNRAYTVKAAARPPHSILVGWIW
jgi:hypothetical protein